MSIEANKEIKTRYVDWDWKAWRPMFNGKPLEAGQRHTAKKWDFNAGMPVWIDVDVVADKYGKLWLCEVESGNLWDLQDMPLLVSGNE